MTTHKHTHTNHLITVLFNWSYPRKPQPSLRSCALRAREKAEEMRQVYDDDGKCRSAIAFDRDAVGAAFIDRGIFVGSDRNVRCKQSTDFTRFSFKLCGKYGSAAVASGPCVSVACESLADKRKTDVCLVRNKKM